jgi:predicted ABC-type ATPase
MAGPRMFIAAGPPGGGKSSFFAFSDFADYVFNADDRAAELNGGSYEKIPTSVRSVVNREFEEFIQANIRAGTSFALETTLRSTITFEQAKLAKENGFRVSMFYVALDTVDRHIERVMRRAARGGHSASESTLRKIHASSLSNLPAALIPDKSGIEIVQIYDNSRSESRPGLVLEARRGQIIRLADSFPLWLQQALGWTDRDLEHRRGELKELDG